MKPKLLDIKSLKIKLEDGSPIIFPTDTVPALASLPIYASKLWEIKKRSLNKPLILMGARVDELFEFIKPIALEDATKMADTYWPGALTMVLPSIGNSVQFLNPTTNTIGVRIPDLVPALELLSYSGPLATTSANFSGSTPVLNLEDAVNTFPEIPLLENIQWPKSSGLASTVISWESKGSWRLLRKGSLMPNMQFK